MVGANTALCGKSSGFLYGGGMLEDFIPGVFSMTGNCLVFWVFKVLRTKCAFRLNKVRISFFQYGISFPQYSLLKELACACGFIKTGNGHCVLQCPFRQGGVRVLFCGNVLVEQFLAFYVDDIDVQFPVACLPAYIRVARVYNHREVCAFQCGIVTV